MTFVHDLLEKFSILQKREPTLHEVLREYRRMQADIHRCYVLLRAYPIESAKQMVEHLEERYYR